MRWLRFVGSLKSQVSFVESFAECRLFYRAVLQKRPKILREPTIRSHPIPERVMPNIENPQIIQACDA